MYDIYNSVPYHNGKFVRNPMVIKFKVFALCLLMVSLAYADVANPFEKNIQLEEQKKIFEQFEKSEQQAPIRFDVQKPSLLPTTALEQCIPIKKISYNSITLLSKKEVENITKTYLGQCVTEESLKNLFNELSTLYLEKGYITSRVYIKEQDISQGELELTAIEGKIEAIQSPSSDIALAFDNQTGEYLNLKELETALSIVNRLPSNSVTMQLIPSEENVGETTIALDNNKTKPYGFEIGANNFGSDKTGKEQLSLRLNYDNLFNINDQISLNLNSTDHHFQNENSKGNSISYSLPIDTVIYTFSYTESDYKQLVPSGTTHYKTDGHTKTYDLSATKEIYHNQANTFNLGAFVTSYDVETYMSDSRIDISSYNLTKAGFSLDYTYRSAEFFSFILVKYIQGTDWFGNHNPTDLDEKYSAFQLDISMMKAIDVLRYKLNFHGQYSDDQLFSVNQLSIGGAYSVRGYQSEGLSGNSGYYLRNELSYPSFAKELISFVDLTPYIALDNGYIRKEEDSDGGRLLSSSIGLQANQYGLFVDLFYSMPLWKESVHNAKPFLGVSLNYKY